MWVRVPPSVPLYNQPNGKKKENSIKKKYNVDKVYTPSGVEIKKVITYSGNTESNEAVYNKIIKSKLENL